MAINSVDVIIVATLTIENSEQTYSDGDEMGNGVILHFHGFSVQVSWEGFDKYA